MGSIVQSIREISCALVIMAQAIEALFILGKYKNIKNLNKLIRAVKPSSQRGFNMTKLDQGSLYIRANTDRSFSNHHYQAP